GRGERQQENNRAEEIDQGSGLPPGLRVENVDPHMPALLERPGRRQQDQPGMRIEHRFLEADRADPERVAQHDYCEFRGNDVERTPDSDPTDRRRGAIDGVGDARDRVSHGYGPYYSPPYRPS